MAAGRLHGTGDEALLVRHSSERVSVGESGVDCMVRETRLCW